MSTSARGSCTVSSATRSRSRTPRSSPTSRARATRRATASPASWVLDAPAAARAARAGRPRSTTLRASRSRWARPGDVVVTLGVGEPWRVGASDRRRAADVMIVAEDVELARLTTIGTGGPARAFAEPAPRVRARAGAARGRERGLSASRPSGSARTCSPRDAGVDVLVVRLTGELADARSRATLLVAGGGATQRRLPAPRACRRTGRLRVRLRDPRHGRRRRLDECRRLRQRLERDPRTGTRRHRRRRGLDDARRARPLLPAFGASAGQVVAQVEYRLRPRPAAEIRAEWQTSSRAARRRSRRTSAPSAPCSRTRRVSSGPAAMLELCGLKGYRIGGALISPTTRQFHRERRWRDNGGLPRADDRGAPARSRGSTASTSSTRSCCSGSSSCLDEVGAGRPAAKQVNVASGGRAEHGSRPRARAASVVVPFPRRESGGRLDLVRLVPSGRSILLAFALLACALLAWLAARDTGSSPFARSTSKALHRRSPWPCTRRSPTTRAPACSSSTWLPPSAPSEALPTVAGVTFDRAFPHTLRIIVVPERPVAIVRQGADSWLVRPAAASSPGPVAHSHPKLARIWIKRDVHLETGGITEGDLMTAVQAVAPAGRLPLPRSGHLRHDGLAKPDDDACAPAWSCAWASRSTSASSWRRGRGDSASCRRHHLSRRLGARQAGRRLTLNSQVEVEVPTSTNP